MSEFLIAWLPMILVFLVFVGGGYLLSKRQMADYGKHVDEVKQINAELIELNRQMAGDLREIKQILKDRN